MTKEVTEEKDLNKPSEDLKKYSVFIIALLGAIVGSLLTIWLGSKIGQGGSPGYSSFEGRQNDWFAGFGASSKPPVGMDFVVAAKQVRTSVVHIKTVYGAGQNLFQGFGMSEEDQEEMERQHGGLGDLFGQGGAREASGSGVIIADDGYIVTNNHVIANAKQINVVLDDKRRFEAELIGTDPSTDLALLKIKASNLPFAPYGNSDSLQIGEWVLAVGNPFELTSTVTAGIVSAKARNINILQGKGAQNMAVESFIQTDAAVNPGNSGGALVNLRGQLIGINTAIASNTGSYSGYSFAVPVTLVKKVMDDLLKYGQVQRAILGISIRDVDAELAEKAGIDNTRGVFVAGALDKGAAEAAGIKAGDVILQIDKAKVNSVSELQEYIARFRPGDKVAVTYERGGKSYTTSIPLKNSAGTNALAKAGAKPVEAEAEVFGARMRAAKPEVKGLLGLNFGVEVLAVDEDGKAAQAGIEPGFVITYVDKKAATSPLAIAKVAEQAKGGVLIEGMYPDGRRAYYALGL